MPLLPPLPRTAADAEGGARLVEAHSGAPKYRCWVPGARSPPRPRFTSRWGRGWAFPGRLRRTNLKPMPGTSAIAELFKIKAVTNDEVTAAVGAYLTNDSAGAFEIAPGVMVDLSGAIERHVPTWKALADAGSSESFRRTMGRTAILLERPIS